MQSSPECGEVGIRSPRSAEVYPDFRVETERFVDVGDEVIVVGIAHGTSTSGIEVKWRQGYVGRIRDGIAVRFCWFNDPAEALRAVESSRRRHGVSGDRISGSRAWPAATESSGCGARESRPRNSSGTLPQPAEALVVAEFRKSLAGCLKALAPARQGHRVVRVMSSTCA